MVKQLDLSCRWTRLPFIKTVSLLPEVLHDPHPAILSHTDEYREHCYIQGGRDRGREGGREEEREVRGREGEREEGGREGGREEGVGERKEYTKLIM